jgi:parvulin-like peptidyl-prolyl isomerase
MTVKISLVLACFLLTLAFATAGVRADAQAPSTDTVVLTFDGGDVMQSDFNAFIDYKTEFFNNGDRRSPQYLLHNNKDAQQSILHRIAFNKIAKTIIQKAGLDEKNYFTRKMKNHSYQAAWQYFMLTHMYPVIAEARKPWQDKWTNYYEEHIDKYREPDEASFRMIFLKTLSLKDEEKEKKYALAEEIRKQLEKDPGAFVPLAKQHSDADESIRGEVMGPYKLDKINPTLAAAIKKLRIHEMSPVVRSDKGAFILLLENFKKGNPKPFPEVKRDIVAHVGEFYVYGIVKDFRKQLIGDAEPVFLTDNVSTATADLDKIIARMGNTEITNREVEYLLPVLYNARFNNPDDIKLLVSDILSVKALYEAAKRKGFFNSQRFANYMNAYAEDQFGDYFIELYQKKELPKQFLDLGEGKEVAEKLLSRYRPRITRYPEIPPL